MRFYSIVLALTVSMAAATNTLRGLQWAAEEIGPNAPENAVDSKDAFAGLEDPMRLAANTVRVKSSLTPLKSDVGLSKAALSLAQELAEKDSTDAPEATQKHLERAQAAGYQGKSVKVNVFSADAKDIDKKDVETHALTAVGGFTASKDATAGLEDPKNTDIGSAGYMSTTGKAYYVQYYGAFR